MMECLPALATLESFGDLYVQLGRASEAQEYYQRALRSVASIFGEDSARASALSHKISTLQQI
jgi:predicted negative regulator of RcsB-dependent stress response